jgi:hypothetical protein
MVKINKKVLIQEETQDLELKTEECQQALWAQKKWSKVKKIKMDFKEIILELLIMLLLAL